MKNKVLLFVSITILGLYNTTIAQGVGEWTWMKGDSTGTSMGHFGTKGVSSPNHNPPGLYEACEWTDLNGNFWVFGGNNNNSACFLRNALWKFDPLTNDWTWIHGDSLWATAVYGTQGIPAPNNVPGPRGQGVESWVDNAGDLWLFGGWGYDAFGVLGKLNDLWRYNIASNQWTWMKGTNSIATSSIIVTGTKGVANIANTPDGRCETSTALTDSQGNLWLYGGLDVVYNAYNDVWKYNVSSNMWTWVAGNQTQSNVTNYGTFNQSSPSNDPGDRHAYAKFIDSQNNLYFLGSQINDPFGPFVMDVWKFNTISTEWTWVGGSNINNYTGAYVTKCDTNTVNAPRTANEIRACWPDSCGFFFLSSSDASLWYFNVDNHQFTWVSSPANSTPSFTFANYPGHYGTIGTSSSTNFPSAKNGALAFRDKQSDLWLFGGTSPSGYANDVWRFKLNPNCGKLCNNTLFSTSLSANFSANIICGNAPLQVQFTNHSVSATTYTWNFGDGSSPDHTSNPIHTYTANGNYTVSLTAQGSGTTTVTVVKNIHVGGLPTASFTTLSNDTLCLNTAFSFNNASHDSIVSSTWSFGDGLGATTFNTFHQYALVGSYTVSLVVTNKYGCKDSVSQKVVVLTPPKAIFTNTPTSGCQPLVVTFTNTSTNATNYLWNFGDGQNSSLTNPTHIFNSSGSLNVNLIAKNSAGCTDTSKTTITIHPQPDASFLLTGYDGCFPYELTAFANTLNLLNYEWVVNGVSISINDSILLGTINAATVKSVTLITKNTFGCTDTSSVIKTLTDDNCGNLFIPNVFTPNGDATNGMFTVKALNFTSYHITIYDRWGLKLFESSDSNIHWNGKKLNTGADCSDGTYFYIIQVTDKKDKQYDYKGFLNLFR